MKDDFLIKRIRTGDEDAAEELVRRYYAQVMRFCRWQCSKNGLAEDLTQETFLKVFRSIDRYRNRGHFKAWLFCVARNICMDELRKQQIEYEPDINICEKRERMRVSIKDKLRENTEKVKAREESREPVRRKPDVTR